MVQPSIAVLVNPERRALLDELLDALGDKDVQLIEPDDAGALEAAVAEVIGSVDVVAAIGGDGTQRTVASVMKGSQTALAVVPGGTVNLLARVLGMTSVDAVAAAIRSGNRRIIDTGVVDGGTFVLNASTGYDAAVMQRVDDGAKRWGRLGYFMTGVRTLWTQRSRHVEVTIDGETFFSGRAMTVMVTNVPQRGSADFELALGGSLDDGLLDVVVQRCDSVFTMARALWALRRKHTPRTDDLVIGHGRTIDVSWSEPVAAQRDGDATAMVTEAHHVVDVGSLTVCIPD